MEKAYDDALAALKRLVASIDEQPISEGLKVMAKGSVVSAYDAISDMKENLGTAILATE